MKNSALSHPLVQHNRTHRMGGIDALPWGPGGLLDVDKLDGYDAAELLNLYGKWEGAWSSAKSYIIGDGVAHNGSSYVCTVAHTNHEPPNSSFWDLLAAKGSQGEMGLVGTWEGTWSDSKAYVVGNCVEYNGSSYMCILANTGQLPTNENYWDLTASKGETGEGVGIYVDALKLIHYIY